jgi:hypothetical protein
MGPRARDTHRTLDRQHAEAEARDRGSAGIRHLSQPKARDGKAFDNIKGFEARDGETAPTESWAQLSQPDITRPRKWTRDIVSAPQELKVLLLELVQRKSAKGTMYLAGWCQKARVVGFLAPEPNEHGEPVWRIYLQQPSPKEARKP